MNPFKHLNFVLIKKIISLQPRVKGYSFALLATVAVSTVYIFSKAALNEVSLAQFGVYWFSMALLWNGLFAMRSKEHRQFRPIPAKSLKILLFLGVLEILPQELYIALLPLLQTLLFLHFYEIWNIFLLLYLAFSC